MRKLAELEGSLPVFPGHAYSGEESTIVREKSTGLLRASITRDGWRRMMAR